MELIIRFWVEDIDGELRCPRVRQQPKQIRNDIITVAAAATKNNCNHHTETNQFENIFVCDSNRRDDRSVNQSGRNI